MARVLPFTVNPTLSRSEREDIEAQYSSYITRARNSAAAYRTCFWAVGVNLIAVAAAWALFATGTILMSAAVTVTLVLGVAVVALPVIAEREAREREDAERLAQSFVDYLVATGKTT